MTRFAKDLIASLQQAVAHSANGKANAEARPKERNVAMRKGEVETRNTILRNSTKAKE